MEPVIGSIEGAWIGSYGYKGGRLPVPFEAKFDFAAQDKSFTGKISDTGPGGDAKVEGSQDGRKVVFTKYYVAPVTKQRTTTIRYEGLLSDDGDSISGRWTLKSSFFYSESGPWQIFRANSNRATAAGASWPPPPSKIFGDPALDNNAYLDAMTAKVFGGQLTLTKPQAPTTVGQKPSSVVAGFVFALAAAFALFAIINVIVIVLRGFDFSLALSLISSLAASAGLGYLVFRWLRLYRLSDVYLIDRNTDAILRNSRKIGAFRDIDHVEVKTIRTSIDLSAVTIVMKDGRRIFIESGRSTDALSLSNDIGQFAGVEVIAIT
jgi:hypothetical protein